MKTWLVIWLTAGSHNVMVQAPMASPAQCEATYAAMPADGWAVTPQAYACTTELQAATAVYEDRCTLVQRDANGMDYYTCEVPL